MLKTRIIPTLLYSNFGLVKGKNFDSWRRTGSAVQQIKVYCLREVDELIFFDIAANDEEREPNYPLITELLNECFMPITIGGGVGSSSIAERILKTGADKVSVNTYAFVNPTLIPNLVKNFGKQCVVAAIDYRVAGEKQPSVYIRSGKLATGVHPVELARRYEQAGAGELLLTCIDREGSFSGFDLATTKAVCDSVSIPVICNGGLGCPQDAVDACFISGVSAVSAGSVFHFTELTPKEIKIKMNEAGIPVRM